MKEKNDQPESANRQGSIQSLARAFSILRFISDHGEGVRLKDIAQGVNLPVSTTHRILTSLETEQFVRSDNRTGTWQIGIGAFIVGNSFIQSTSVIELAFPYLKQLVARFSESASIYVENEGEAVCMEQIESHHMMRAITRVGGRAKMHCSGSGKAMLAYLDESDIKQIIGHHGLPQMTEKTITSMKLLTKNLNQIRKQGYAIDDEEAALGVRCIAVPLFDHQGKPVAAISVSGPLSRINNSRVEEIAAGLKDSSQKIIKEIGGHVSL